MNGNVKLNYKQKFDDSEKPILGLGESQYVGSAGKN